MRSVRIGLGAVVLALGAVGAWSEPGGAQQRHENLRVLPQDISPDRLSAVMVANLQGLGLPRRGGEGCLFCHVGSMDVPRGEWDFASDDKVQKRKAREMLAMVAEINGRLAGLESRVAPELEVTCYTCHAGRTDPRSLSELLADAYDASGVDSLSALYENLRARYFGADAYDFRTSVLFEVAGGIAAAGSFGDALEVSRLNERHNPESQAARRGTLLLELNRALAEGGVGAAIARFDEQIDGDPGDVMTSTLLDGLGWSLYRRDRVDDALRIFRRNLSAFPEEYAPHESLADALYRSGRDREEGIAIMERWIEAHPDDEQARQVLQNLLEIPD